VTPLALVEETLVRSWETAFIAFRALRRNKLRSALTALGVLIGVFSIIAIASLDHEANGWLAVSTIVFLALFVRPTMLILNWKIMLLWEMFYAGVN
jgi:hypothetical protein